MATLSIRGRFISAGVGVLSVTALCVIGLATCQLADIRAEVTRILDHQQADLYARQLLKAPDGEFNYTLNGQDQWTSARSFKDWKWIIGYSSPVKIKYADARAIGLKMTALHRNLVLTSGLIAVATALFLLLTGRVMRSVRDMIANLAAGMRELPTITGQMADAGRGIAEKPSARTDALDQALHETWDQRPREADPNRKTAGTKTPQDPSAIRPDEVIPPDESELTDF